jgi:low affinity Fe/Cu permease
MADAQLISIAITVLAILGGTLINNSRISDINGRLGDVKEVLRAEFRADMAQMEARMDNRFNSIDHKLDEILRIVGEHETRIARLEERRPL